MGYIKINTDAVNNTATTLTRINNTMKSDFSQVKQAMRTLNSYWDGAAASAAMEKFSNIESNFVSARHTVMANYVNFMRQQVGQGYESTESTNVTLASRFK